MFLNGKLATKEQIDKINWEKRIDKESLLKQCNRNKMQKIWHEKQRLKSIDYEKKRKDELKAFWTASRFYQQMIYSHSQISDKPFKYDCDNEILVKSICYLLSKDERYETELGFIFKKGLWIRGNCGVGKSYLIKLVADNELNSVQYISMVKLAKDLKKGIEPILSNDKTINLDDVGSEEITVNNYGNKTNWFKEFIEMAYFNTLDFSKFIVSSNDSFDLIEEKYSYRVRERIREKFNILDVNFESLRK